MITRLDSVTNLSCNHALLHFYRCQLWNLDNATLQQQSNQFAHTSKESAADRALTRDMTISSNDLAMQMKFMDSDLADKRMAYDRETRRMDKRDRMIANLMSGIGQLGGAFAL